MFVTGRLFQPSLTHARMAQEAALGCFIWVGSGLTPKRCFKSVPGTTTLVCWAHSYVTKKIKCCKYCSSPASLPLKVLLFIFRSHRASGGIQTLDVRIMSRVFCHCAFCIYFLELLNIKEFHLYPRLAEKWVC